jgi:translocation protein SEC63
MRIARRENGSIFAPRLSKRCAVGSTVISQHAKRCHRTYFLIAGWSLFAFLCYKVAGVTSEGQVYDPFEILGISAVSLLSFLTYYSIC